MGAVRVGHIGSRALAISGSFSPNRVLTNAPAMSPAAQRSFVVGVGPSRTQLGGARRADDRKRQERQL